MPMRQNKNQTEYNSWWLPIIDWVQNFSSCTCLWVHYWECLLHKFKADYLIIYFIRPENPCNTELMDVFHIWLGGLKHSCLYSSVDDAIGETVKYSSIHELVHEQEINGGWYRVRKSPHNVILSFSESEWSVSLSRWIEQKKSLNFNYSST